MPGRVFVITGPSGVGKGTLIRTLLERVPELELAVSATTRAPRPGEEDGVHYHFLDDVEFDRRVVDEDFLEHAEYSGRRYGTLRSELDKRTAGGVHLVSVPLEGGHMRAMNWVLANRVGPLLTQGRHPTDLIFGITWWDSCRRNGHTPEFDPNVVSRAWTARDYFSNVARDGLTDTNRNYASYRWQQSLSFSSLIQRRATAAKC